MYFDKINQQRLVGFEILNIDRVAAALIKRKGGKKLKLYKSKTKKNFKKIN